MMYHQMIYHGPMTDEVDSRMMYGNVGTLVMALLARTPLHGYRLRQVLAETSRNSLHVSLSRLYPLLAALEKRGLVRSSVVKAGESREQRVYSVTPRGRKELKLRVWKWRRFAAGVERILTSAKVSLKPTSR
jgi:PadR family transcriptional regulator, regulatory protein PadR